MLSYCPSSYTVDFQCNLKVDAKRLLFFAFKHTEAVIDNKNKKQYDWVKLILQDVIGLIYNTTNSYFQLIMKVQKSKTPE